MNFAEYGYNLDMYYANMVSGLYEIYVLPLTIIAFLVTVFFIIRKKRKNEKLTRISVIISGFVVTLACIIFSIYICLKIELLNLTSMTPQEWSETVGNHE